MASAPDAAVSADAAEPPIDAAIPLDGARSDVAEEALTPIDRPTPDVPAAVDAADASEAPDSARPDVTEPADAATDLGAMLDAPSVTDVAVDRVAPPDVVAVDAPPLDVPADVTRDATVDVATDRPTTDATPVDARVDAGAPDVTADVPAPDTGSCTGAGPTVTISAPTAGEMIETCSTANLPVYYDFSATVAGSAAVRVVTARWITPDGPEAPPGAGLTAGPYRFRRQVGGDASGVPALAVFGLRGTWRFEATATDVCGRSATASQNFTLIFTSRRCPNP